MDEMSRRRDFWTGYQPGFRTTHQPPGSRAFFDEVTTRRYALEPHIPEIVGFERWARTDVLEAGCGIGTDGARFAAAGARYTGLDFSPTALRLARRRFDLDELSGRFVAGSVTSLPFADGTFDLVFSHGVIHHVHDSRAAAHEFHRVLKPGGTLLVMVYHRRSFNYYVTIMGVRRVMALLLLLPGAASMVAKMTREPDAVIASHRSLLAAHGLRYVRDRELFLSHNTDGPGNPLSKVFTRADIRAMVPDGCSVRTQVRYLNLRLYPGGRRMARSALASRLERRIGWHLYLEGRKK